MKNAQKGLIIIACTFLLAGCTSSGKLQGDIADTIGQSSENNGRLNVAVEDIADTSGKLADTSKRLGEISSNLASELRNINNTEREIGIGVSAVEQLLGDYQNLLDRVLNEIERLRAEIEAKE